MNKQPCETCNGTGTLCDLTVSPPEDVPCEDCDGAGRGKYEKLTTRVFEEDGYGALIRELAKT